MKPVSIPLMEMLLNQLPSAPDGQISEAVRERLISFNNAIHTPTEMYDFIVGLSHEEITEVSSFVQEMCALDMYYERP